MTFSCPSFLAAAIRPLMPPNAAAEAAVEGLTPLLLTVVTEPHAVTIANAANAMAARANLFTCFDIFLCVPQCL
jgi:hypothetical protein